jgi:hypothetical protein
VLANPTNSNVYNTVILVTQTARWLKRRSKFINAFAIWYVHYPDGKPEVFPLLRRYFDKEKSARDVTDAAMFDQEILGRSMFYKRVHGSCTSYAVYCATAMRALGSPPALFSVFPRWTPTIVSRRKCCSRTFITTACARRSGTVFHAVGSPI